MSGKYVMLVVIWTCESPSHVNLWVPLWGVPDFFCEALHISQTCELTHVRHCVYSVYRSVGFNRALELSYTNPSVLLAPSLRAKGTVVQNKTFSKFCSKTRRSGRHNTKRRAFTVSWNKEARNLKETDERAYTTANVKFTTQTARLL